MHEKEYIVTIDREVTPTFVHGMANGVPLTELNAVTRQCQVEKLGKHTFRIVLTQGLNRQIRRMCEYFGCRVKSLKRIRIMNIELGSLEPGKYRAVTDKELTELYRLIAGSSNETVIPEKEKRKTGGSKDGGRRKGKAVSFALETGWVKLCGDRKIDTKINTKQKENQNRRENREQNIK